MYLKQWCLVGLVFVTFWYFPVECESSDETDESYSYSTEANAKCSLPGETYTGCGTACPKTCSNYNQTDTVCTLQCVSGCFCNPGLIRDSTGNCIDPASCPSSCGKNEEYKECGTVCETTCDNYNQTDRICQAMCRPGCSCQEGFVRDSYGSCIKIEDCPTTNCPANSKYNSCGTKCEQTCGNLGIKINCNKGCAQGCFCDIGYVKTKNGQCVTPKDCPADEVCTRPNEQFSECPSTCPKTCANYFSPPSPCALYCLAGCECKYGYVRNENNLCVKLEDCPGLCPGKNEYYECGSACDTTCDNYDEICPIVNIKCTELCRCKPGYARNSKKECIPIDECPPKLPKCNCRNKF